MSKHFVQKEEYGCGVYALANTFNDATMITDARLEESKSGGHMGHLNKWLLEDNKNLFIHPFYYSDEGKKIPKFVCDLLPAGENVLSLPILINIQERTTTKPHLVCADILTTGELMVFDSLKDDMILTTLEQYNRVNFRLHGIWYFRHMLDGNILMKFK